MKNGNIYGLSIMGASVLGSFSSLQAECPCARNQPQVSYSHPQMGHAPMVMEPTTITPAPTTFPLEMNPQYPQTMYPQMMQGPMMSATSPAATMNMYQDLKHYRTAREIPASKPPRVGMVDIKVTGAAEVKVYDTHPFREEDLLDGYQDKHDNSVWRFESKPLVDGIPHVYKIVVFDAQGATQSRYIRLVPGRIVDVSF